MRVLSLFAGIGGFDLGFEMAGWQTVGQVEIDPYCNQVLKEHWPNVARWTDICTVTADDIRDKCGTVDVICGGFPCQDISAAGKGAGLDGARSSLWWEMHRLIRDLRPRWVIIENVDAIRTRGLDRVVGALEGDDFQVWCFRMAAENVGAPHQRKRMLIVAHNTSERWQPRRTKSKGQQRIFCLTGSGASMVNADSEHGRAGSVETGRPVVASVQISPKPGCNGDLADANNHGLLRSDISEERGEILHGSTGSCGDRLERRGPNQDISELADAGSCRSQSSIKWSESEKPVIAGDCGIISNTDCGTIRIEQGRAEQRWPYSPFAFPAGPRSKQFEWEEPKTIESTMGITADGIPLRLALKACGNGFVPAIPYLIARAIQRLGSL